MDPSTGVSGPRPRDGDIAAFIRAHGESILEEWQREVRKLPSAEGLDRPTLIDHVPDLLNRIADLADEVISGRPAELPRDAAERHAVDRLSEGFDLSEVVEEYSVLRHCIQLRWERHSAGGNVVGITAFNQAIDRAVSASVSRYVSVRDRTLRGLDRVAQVALESADLDDLLQNLLRVMLETTAAVDTAVILLREGDRLRVRAAAGLEVEVDEALSVAIGEGFAGKIAAEQRPLLHHTAPGEPLVESDLLRARGVRALFGVPLIDGRDVIGVAQIGSLSAYDFSEQDKRLLEAMSHRATAAIVQHALREAAERRAEELRSSEARLRGIVENAPVAVYIKDEEGRCMVGNARFASMLGVAPTEVVGKREDELFRPEAVASMRAADDDLRAAKEPRMVEEALDLPTGRRTFLTVKFPVPGPGGTTWLGGISTDITDRKRDEEEQAFLDAITQELASSLDVKATAQRLAQLAVPRLGDSCGVEILTDEGALQSIVDLRRSGLVSELAVPMVSRGRPLGALTFAMGESSRQFDKRTTYLAGEVASRAALALDNARLYQDARAAVEVREAVLRVVSHDLRSPLSAIHMGTALLLRRTAGDAAARRQLETIQRAAGRMERLIGDLLDMASIEAGRLAVEVGVHDGEAILAEALELHQAGAAEGGIELVLDADLAGVKVRCDRDRVEQVLANLLGNALKFCSRGDRVVLGARADDDVMEVTVSDTGPGIGADVLHRVFEPYWSGPRDQKRGTGLGLFISKGIVDAHGGTLTAESALGEGTTFRFTLPVHAR